MADEHKTHNNQMEINPTDDRMKMDAMDVDESMDSLMLLDNDEDEMLAISFLMTTRNHQGE